MDITVVSPTQVHLLAYHHPQSEQLCIAHWREEQKRKKYEQSLDAEHILFVPLAVESFGGWGTASIPIFKTLARMVANRSDQIRSASFISILLAISKVSHCIAEEQCLCNDSKAASCLVQFFVVPIVLCSFIHIHFSGFLCVSVACNPPLMLHLGCQSFPLRG